MYLLDSLKIRQLQAAAYEKQAQALVFLAKLNLFAAPLYAVMLLGVGLVPLQQLVAGLTYSLLAAAGFNPSVDGLLISIPISNGSWGAFINWDCTAWKSMFAFFALTMAADRNVTPKALGLALFLPLIFIVNLLRIFFMFAYVRTFDVAFYGLVHDTVWSWGMIFAVVVFWLIWMMMAR